MKESVARLLSAQLKQAIPQKTQKLSRFSVLIGISLGVFGTIVTLAILPATFWPERGLEWTGIGPDSVKSEITEKTIENGKVVSTKESTTKQFQSPKTLWDWLGLFGALAIPILIYQFEKNEQRRAEERAQAEQERAEQQLQHERELADENLYEEALQNYLDRISDIWIKGTCDISVSNYPPASTLNLIRIHTLTALRRLDGERKGIVIRYLANLEILNKFVQVQADLKRDFLMNADLSDADLSDIDLNEANLRRTILTDANLSRANLCNAHLCNAHLSGTKLCDANLEGADFRGVQHLTLDQIKSANNWEKAHYDDDLCMVLGLSPEPTLVYQYSTNNNLSST